MGVEGAIGVAFFISIMALGQRNFLTQSSRFVISRPLARSGNAGVHNAFLFGFGFAVLAFILVLFIKRTEMPEE